MKNWCKIVEGSSDFDPQRKRSYFSGPNICSKFYQNRTVIVTVEARTDRQTDRRTQVILWQSVSIACYPEPCISYGRVVHLSVHPSHGGTEWERRKLGSRNLHWRITQGLWFSEIRKGSLRAMALNESGVGKIHNFQPISHHVRNGAR